MLNKAFDDCNIDNNEGESGDFIQNMIDRSKFFFIDNRQFYFDDQDPIFIANGPAEQQQFLIGQTCNCCDQKVKNPKTAQYCEFCGEIFCKQCIIKSRPYPMNNEDYRNRGEVCKVCDRKFYIQKMVQSSRVNIDNSRFYIKDLQKQLTKKENECQELDEEFDQFNETIRLEKDRIKLQRKRVKREKKTLDNEMVQINEDCNTLREKKESISIETKEVQLQLSQSASEKTRLEDEQKKYTKIGKQPRGNQSQQKYNRNYQADHSIMNSSREDLRNTQLRSDINLSSTIIASNSVVDPEYQQSMKTVALHNLSTMNSPEYNNKYLNGSGLLSQRNSLTKKKNQIRRDNPGYCGPGNGCKLF
ncbi:UNKNOWN [Stylonychia lemnae]|uniref:FYVE-type domain-containing protein n=1 Tax=Stylonychia lemnae TaxID=5949 RepID=A0A078AWZ3_STYLE|nr:UNKNOWN [Stylonychia lemnae]|eukprot:CDW86581.1 UNKNOWN [Stylonychia lemnae]